MVPSLSSASKSAREFGSAVRALDMQARQVQGLERQETAVRQAEIAWKNAEASVKALADRESNAASFRFYRSIK